MNDVFLQHIREGKIDYIRGDTIAYTAEGVHVNVRGKVGVSKSDSKRTLQSETFAASNIDNASMNGGSNQQHSSHDSAQMIGGSGIDAGQGGRFTKKGAEGKEEDIPADIVVIATGFAQPPVDFLPKDLFPEGYERPNLYLQNFSTEDWSIVLTNAAYKNGIGSVYVKIELFSIVLMTGSDLGFCVGVISISASVGILYATFGARLTRLMR